MKWSSAIIMVVWICQVLLAQSVQQAIEQALAQGGMRWSDLILPSDFVERDRHRLSAVEEVFRNPMALLQLGNQVTAAVDSLHRGTSIGEQLIALCEYHPLQLPRSSVQWEYYPADSSVAALLKTSLVYHSIIEQYLHPVESYRQATEQFRRLLRSQPLLMTKSDSLWLLSREDENADPYQLRAAEVRSDSLARQFFEAALLADPSTLLAEGLRLYVQLLTVVQGTRQARQLFHDSIRTVVWDTPLGRCAIGGPGDDIYRGDFVFIFDVGGNDTYLLETSRDRAFSRGIQVIIDLEGNDTYTAGDYTLAAGISGCGILLDLAGDDSYRGGNFSLGCGVWGVGILYDERGNDRYSGGTFAQAAAAFGIGILLDSEGNDNYQVAAHGQAFAGTRGLAVLADYAGNDLYTTSSPFVDVLRYDSHYLAFTQGAALGYRPIASGGIALLSDRSGNDVYISDIYGQGTAYWFGIGILDDHAGEDRYIAYQYVQGAGIHFAHGLLWDRSGNDLYFARGVAQGCGHDVGIGMLLEEEGDDSYCVESLSLGGGNANAISIFVDRTGDDTYSARNDSNTRGFSDLRRGLPMVGVFVDAGGQDRYALPLGNGTVQLKSTVGIALDAADTTMPHRKQSTLPHPIPSLPSSLDSLFVLASTAPQKYQHFVTPARNAIVERGAAALPFLSTKFGTRFPRERLALEDVVPRLYAKDSVAVMTLIADSLSSSQQSTVLFCLWVIGKCRIGLLADSLIRFFRHRDWRVRAAAAQQVGEGKFHRIVSHLVPLLQDIHPWVRARAASAIAATDGLHARDRLLRALRDSNAIVRISTVLGLRSNPDRWNPATLAVLLRDAGTEDACRAVAVTLALLDSTSEQFSQQWVELERVIVMLPATIRATCYRALAGSPIRCRLVGLLERESDRALADEVRRILAMNPCPATQPVMKRRSGFYQR